jgi:hypothetical protein
MGIPHIVELIGYYLAESLWTLEMDIYNWSQVVCRQRPNEESCALVHNVSHLWDSRFAGETLQGWIDAAGALVIREMDMSRLANDELAYLFEADLFANFSWMSPSLICSQVGGGYDCEQYRRYEDVLVRTLGRLGYDHDSFMKRFPYYRRHDPRFVPLERGDIPVLGLQW